MIRCIGVTGPSTCGTPVDATEEPFVENEERERHDHLDLDWRTRHSRRPRQGFAAQTVVTGSPWLTVHDAAERCKCGVKVIYREVKAGRLRAARIGGRRELRLLAEWIDEWLIASTAVM
jgi:excisionase family DNA binding protein